MQSYLHLLSHILKHGERHEDRTGVGTISVFGYQWRHRMSDGFPLLTTKRLAFRWIAEELFFFLRGDTNRKSLNKAGVDIWDEWGDHNGNLGPVYGHQWRRFGGRHENRPQPRPGRKGSILGIASRGKYRRGSNKIMDGLLTTWMDMISRCYNKNKDTYPYCGGCGVYVVDSWLDFDSFAVDVQNLCHWEEKLQNWGSYFLDKDVCGDGFSYGPETCCWLTRTDSCRAERRAENLELIEIDNLDAGFDQIDWLMEQLKTSPESRRLVISSWNPPDIFHMALPPCHTLWQLKVHDDDSLSLHLYARSIDSFLGLPYNIASYALLLTMIAKVTGREMRDLIVSFGDLHIYKNHYKQVKKQLSREPRELPRLEVEDQSGPDSLSRLLSFNYEHLHLSGYDPYPKIPAPVAV